MKAILSVPKGYEFYFADRDTLVLVENNGEQVVIRATRDTFSEQRKVSFIRELASEGFIADRYHWFPQLESESLQGVRWIVDWSWLHISDAVLKPARRFMAWSFGTGFALWSALMIALLAGSLPLSSSLVASKSAAAQNIISDQTVSGNSENHLPH